MAINVVEKQNKQTNKKLQKKRPHKSEGAPFKFKWAPFKKKTKKRRDDKEKWSEESVGGGG